MKLKTKSVKMINCYDLDDLINETYGKLFHFQQQDGCKGRGVHNITVPVKNPYDYDRDKIPEIINGQTMGVSFKAWLERDYTTPLNPTKKDFAECNYYWGKTKEEEKAWKEDKSHIDLFWERNFYPSLDMVLNDLHAKGLIDAGEYTIEIDW